MDRRQFTAASAALLTVGIAGCSQSNADETPSGNSTSTDMGESTATTTDTPTSTGMSADDGSGGTQLQYEGDVLTLENAPEQEIRGTSDLEPGSAIEIVLDSETAGDPFLKRPQTTALDDGMFSTTVDMSDTDEGTEFTIEVLHDDETLTEADGQVI